MTPQEEKTITQLVKAIETTYNSPSRTFWRGFLWGLGRGLGNVVGWLLLLAILVYLFQISGLGRAFHDIIDTMSKISSTFNSFTPR